MHEQAVAFHNATKYYALSDVEPSDDRIGIGDPADRTAAIWQKDWDIKPLLYKVYESLPAIELPRELPDTGVPTLGGDRRDRGRHRRAWSPTRPCSAGSAS